MTGQQSGSYLGRRPGRLWLCSTVGALTVGVTVARSPYLTAGLLAAVLILIGELALIGGLALTAALSTRPTRRQAAYRVLKLLLVDVGAKAVRDQGERSDDQ